MNNSLSNKVHLVCIICLSLVVTAAQDQLPKGSFERWSKTDAERVLNDSPWARKQELRLKFDKEVQKAAVRAERDEVVRVVELRRHRVAQASVPCRRVALGARQRGDELLPAAGDAVDVRDGDDRHAMIIPCQKRCSSTSTV